MSQIEAAFFGVLGRDCESKVSKNGKPYLRLAVRVGDGESSQWINVTSFDADAIAAADRLTKGARLYVEGRLQLDEWQAQDGTAKHGLSCMSWHTRLAQIGRNKPKRDGDGVPSPANQQAQRSNDFHDDPLPF
jgi:single-strand DNA-binding protein